MATYVISDIHGNLRALQALLVDIDFKYDGSDKLCLLGDYVDWGPDSIATVEFVMNLSELPFVKCIMGNHDLMFLDEIERERHHNSTGDPNWMFNNRGMDTWVQYLDLPAERQDKMYKWLSKLPYGIQIRVNKKWYLLCHAGPYLPQKKKEVDESVLSHDKLYAVWHRIQDENEKPLDGLYARYPHFRGKQRDFEAFICGHTINSFYRKPAPDEPLSIFKGPNFINIDCGAKCMSLVPGLEYMPPSVINASRLAALRLDDMAEFYCDRDRAGYTAMQEYVI